MSCRRALLILQRRSYSQPAGTSITPEARRKWGLSGLPSPQSILNDDETPLPPSLSLSSSSSTITEEEDDGFRRNPTTPPVHLRKPPTQPTPSEWSNHRLTLKKSFPQGWSPPKKLSRSAMDGLRTLHSMDPEKFSTPVLAERFRVSPEAVRRILKSKWEPSEERREKWLKKEKREKEERQERRVKVFESEREEALRILEGKMFSGGLSLRERRDIPRGRGREGGQEMPRHREKLRGRERLRDRS